MWSSIGVTGVLALLGVTGGRVVIMWLALRGTKPRERPEIIRALNDGGAKIRRSRRAVDNSDGG